MKDRPFSDISLPPVRDLFKLAPLRFASLAAGPRLLVLGAVHGNELCGPRAIQRLLDELESGTRSLERGAITFVPVCNPQAYLEQRRFIEVNLNRVVCDPAYSSDGTSYEHKLGNQLARLIPTHDFLVDLHSFTASGQPFVVEDLDSKEQCEFADSIGLSPVISGVTRAIQQVAGKRGDTTIACAARHGIPGLVVECGQHQSDQAVDMAYQVAVRAIDTLLGAGVEPGPRPRRLQVTEAVFKRTSGEFCREWGHLDAVRKDEEVAVTADGIIIRAPHDGYIVLPSLNVATEGEWFYFARDLSSTDKP